MPQLMGGAQIRNVRDRGNVGTLGCVVCSRKNPAERYLLTAGHVINAGGYAREGDVIEAKLPGEERWEAVASFKSAIKLRDAQGALQVCDAALARLHDGVSISEAIVELGRPRGTAGGLYEGMALHFYGAGSGLVRTAAVHSTGNEVPVVYRDVATGGTFTLQFLGQVLYGQRAGVLWSEAARPGDSGALVLNQDGLAVGLHLGRTPDDYSVRASVCTPIATVFEALDVTLPALAGRAAPADMADMAGTAAPDGVAVAPPPASTLSGADAIGIRGFEVLGVSLRSLLEPHNPFGGVPWQLTRDGLVVDGRLERSPGALVTVPRVWRDFGSGISAAAARHGVPVELILATLCTESSGRADAVRIEPGWRDDVRTPNKVSAGLMQTLISTARWTTGNEALDRAALLAPDVSLDAGTSYISRQRLQTRLDPPLVACAYNAGGVYLNGGRANRWKLRQYPIGTGAHADRFTQWFNDCFAYFAANPGQVPEAAPSFFRLLGPA